LHDIGHWPFCHPIEDIRLPEMPTHEHLARRFLADGELAEAVRGGWGFEPDGVISLLCESPSDTPGRILSSLLSGPIDIDKMDYLFRDSLHAGVPYGRNFDQPRLIGSLCLNAAGDALAITDKGKTAAELMVFARYVMFSEVYWHHAVRSATAMLQRAFYVLYKRLNLDALFGKNEAEWIAAMMSAADGQPANELLTGLFGPRRSLYKRLAQYSYFQDREVYERLARRPYPWLAQCAQAFAERAAAALGAPVAPHEVLFDAPPVEREVEFDIDVYFAKEGRYRPLGEVSPVVQALARRQFDDYVKRVRIFVHPRIADRLRALPVRDILEQTLDDAGGPP
jgi:HD superfamily phosphohydrolase